MSKIKQLAGQTLIYGLGQILPRILHFIVFTWYLTHRLNDNRGDYADYTELYAYASLLVVFFSYRMDTSMFRFGKTKEDLPLVYGTAFSALLISALVLIVIGVFFSQPIADVLLYQNKPHYISWFCWIIAFDIMNLLPFAKLRLEGHAKQFVKYKVYNIALTILLVLLTLEWLPTQMVQNLIPFCKSDIDFVFFANLVASAILFATLMIRHFPTKISIDPGLWKKMALYGMPLVLVGIAGSINQFFAVPLQKYFLGGEVELNKDRAAVYGAVQKIPALLALFTTAYNYAAEPFFFKNADDVGAKTLYGQITLYFIIIGGVACVGLNCLVYLFSFLIGPNFREGLYLIPVLLMAYLFLGIYYNVSIWYKLADKTGYGALIATFGALITLIGNFILLPLYGVDASAWIALLCYVFMVWTAWILGRKYYPIKYPLGQISTHLGLIVFFLVIGSISNELYSNSLWRGIIILLVYLGIIAGIERDKLRAIIPKLTRAN